MAIEIFSEVSGLWVLDRKFLKAVNQFNLKFTMVRRLQNDKRIESYFSGSMPTVRQYRRGS